MDFVKQFEKKASEKKRKIGIAILRPTQKTVESIKKAAKYADLTVLTLKKIPGLSCIVLKNDVEMSWKLISLLKEKKIEGIVRGQVKDSATLAEYYKQFRKKKLPDDKKVCAGLLSNGKYSFFVGSCSIYQGMTYQGKKHETERIISYMRSLGIVPKIAVMSARRPTGVRGKYKMIEDIEKNCHKLFLYLKRKKFNVKEYYIDHELAVWDKSNLIICSVGIVGNAWLKALIQFSDFRMIASPYLDLGVVWEDGSRNEDDFYHHIVHAVAMLNGSD